MRFRFRVGAIRTSLAANTLWSLAGQGSSLVIQTLSFILITRELGVGQYGLFVAALALIGVFRPFAGWGSGTLLVMQAARNPQVLPHAWGASIITTSVTGLVAGGAAVGASWFVMPEFGIRYLVLLAVSDCFLIRISEISAQVFQGLERIKVSTFLTITTSGLRLVAVMSMMSTTSTPSIRVWVSFYFVSAVVAALLSVLTVTLVVGTPVFAWRLALANVREGSYFAISLASLSIYTDIDKVMLSRLADDEATGVYAAAYRVVTMAFVPIRSLLYAANARYFRAGSAGLRSTTRLSWRLMPFALGWSTVAGVGLLAGASIVPKLLGSEYEGAVATIRWLSLLPAIQAIHYLGADALTGAGHQRLRTLLQISIAVLNVILNFLLIPGLSWLGAVYATLASEALLGVLIWSAVIRLNRPTSSRTSAVR